MGNRAKKGNSRRSRGDPKVEIVQAGWRLADGRVHAYTKPRRDYATEGGGDGLVWRERLLRTDQKKEDGRTAAGVPGS